MNKVMIIGRLTKDPDLRFAQGKDMAICRFNLAVTRQFKKEESDFINCIAFGKTGEIISQYSTKGNQLAIVGHIQTGSYDAQDGSKRYTTDVVIESFTFIGGGNSKSQNSNNQQQNNQQQNDSFSGGFYDNITPVDDGDMPF